MRTLMIASLALMLGMGAAPAEAQRLGVQGGATSTSYRGSLPRTGVPATQARTQRWGGQVNGRWYGGSRAPGGWNAYRRPTRGWNLPRYWVAPTFYIGDYGSYGLSTPPYGYRWSRYYDDAVLMDARGQVWDSVSGLDWDRYDDGYAYGQGGDGGSASYGYAYGGAGGTAGGGYAQQGYRPASPPSYGTSYDQPVREDYRYEQRGAPPVVNAQPNEVVQQGGYTESRSSGSSYSGGSSSGGYVSGGYWYPPTTTTTVTVQSAPVIETTTTEYIEETTTYTAPRRVYRAKKKVWKPRPVARRSCNCGCCR